MNENGEPGLTQLPDEEGTSSIRGDEEQPKPSMLEKPSTSSRSTNRHLDFNVQTLSTSCDTPVNIFSIRPNKTFAGICTTQGMRYVFQLVPEEDETTFEAVIKSRGRPNSAPSQPQKKHRISMHSAAITDTIPEAGGEAETPKTLNAM